MQYFVVTDEEGFCKAFYVDTIHGENVPAEAFPISEQQWLLWVTEQRKVRWDPEKKDLVEVPTS